MESEIAERGKKKSVHMKEGNTVQPCGQRYSNEKLLQDWVDGKIIYYFQAIVIATILYKFMFFSIQL